MCVCVNANKGEKGKNETGEMKGLCMDKTSMAGGTLSTHVLAAVVAGAGGEGTAGVTVVDVCAGVLGELVSACTSLRMSHATKR